MRIYFIEKLEILYFNLLFEANFYATRAIEVGEFELAEDFNLLFEANFYTTSSVKDLNT